MSRAYCAFATLLLVVLFVSACQPIQAPVTSYTPRFDPAACKYEIPEGDQVECGYLIVPEDRSNPDEPTIRNRERLRNAPPAILADRVIQIDRTLIPKGKIP